MKRISRDKIDRLKRVASRRWKHKLRRRKRAHFRRLGKLDLIDVDGSGDGLVDAIVLFRKRRILCPNAQIEERPEELRTALICPKELNLVNNYVETVGFFAGLQAFIHLRPRQKGRTKYVDFRHLKTIDVGSLLVLAAELDMALGRESKGLRRSYDLHADVHLWQPGIAYLFQEFGILELTGYRPAEAELEAIKRHPYIMPVRFRRDPLVKGKLADELVQEVGNLTPSRDEAQRGRVYTALTEAMTNTNMHAYPEGFHNFPGRTMKCWWGGAQYDSASKTAYFVMYDRGVGLPKTIPKHGWAKELISAHVNSDAQLIQAALRSPRSSTGEPQHGLGLRQMAEVVDSRPQSHLRIFSGRGLVTYVGKDNMKAVELPVDFGGTLIEWKICDQF